MRRKNIIVAISLTGCLTCLMTYSSAVDRFYYGAFEGDSYNAATLRDSLKFNIVVVGMDSVGKILNLADNSLRAIVASNDSSSPTYWSVLSHYTLWEAEGYLNSNYNLRYYGKGTKVYDPGASGDTAMYFSDHSDSGLIQTGPYYDQECFQDSIIKYTAEFRLRSSSGSPSIPICSLMVVNVDRNNDTIILKTKTLNPDSFPSVDLYKTFKLDYRLPLPPSPQYYQPVEFWIYWYGNRPLYVDYVKVYDKLGWQLIDDSTHTVANRIKTYVSQPWVTYQVYGTSELVVYHWYMRDEPDFIDAYEPYHYINSLLETVSTERLGFQAFNFYTNQGEVHEYLLREDPKEYCIDPYPTHRLNDVLGHNYTGSAYQSAWDTYIDWLNRAKIAVDSLNKDLWVTIQAHLVASSKPADVTNCTFPLISFNGTSYCPLFREPTAEELRLQTFLSLCYGAHAILHYIYGFRDLPWYSQLETGLYDGEHDSSTYKWREIKNFIAPRVDKLGSILIHLNWLGACVDSSNDRFDLLGCGDGYLDSIRSDTEPHWVQMGFFENQVGDTSYFMLVNRECLESEGANYNVFVTKTGGPYQIRDVYTGLLVGYVAGTSDNFTIYLGPGEGKLLRVENRERIIHVPSDYDGIQKAINAAWDGDTVLVVPGTYYENINFIGKHITVASNFIFDHNPSTIEATIIDGSHPNKPDSASVVRFVSGEDSSACIKGFTLRYGSGTRYQWSYHLGGGILCWYNTSPTISNNIIMLDTANYGGGIYCVNTNSSPIIINNIIKGNKASFGGGISAGNSGIIIANNIIVQNIAISDGGGIGRASGIITNNTIYGNSAPYYGGGLNVEDGTCRIVNNIIVNSQGGGGIYFPVYPDSIISSNNVWNNTGGNFSGYYHSGCGDTSWGTNRNGTPCDSFYNIIRNPIFVNPGTDYHLQESSPCINAGNNNAPGLPYFDFDGNTRIRGGYVDMGVYEYITFIRGDVNNSGAVELGDVVYLISYLYKNGPAPNPLLVGDVNCSGMVELGDVVFLISYLYKGGPAPLC